MKIWKCSKCVREQASMFDETDPDGGDEEAMEFLRACGWRTDPILCPFCVPGLDVAAARALVDSAHREDSIAGLEEHYERLRHSLARALDEIEALTAKGVHLFDKLAADRLADEVDALVRRKVIDMRSPAADALLDYREPPSTPRSDRLADIEDKLAKVRRQRDEARELARSHEREYNALRDRHSDTEHALNEARTRIADLESRMRFIELSSCTARQTAFVRLDPSGELRHTLLREIGDAARGKVPDYWPEMDRENQQERARVLRPNGEAS